MQHVPQGKQVSTFHHRIELLDGHFWTECFLRFPLSSQHLYTVASKQQSYPRNSLAAHDVSPHFGLPPLHLPPNSDASQYKSYLLFKLLMAGTLLLQLGFMNSNLLNLNHGGQLSNLRLHIQLRQAGDSHKKHLMVKLFTTPTDVTNHMGIRLPNHSLLLSDDNYYHCQGGDIKYLLDHNRLIRTKRFLHHVQFSA